MSWIDKEMRRRQRLEGQGRSGLSTASAADAQSAEPDAMAALWARIEQAHAKLPPELQLTRQTPATASLPEALAMCQVVWRAANGAGIGFAGNGIRYAWPKPRLKKSNNFWIRSRPSTGYYLSRRVKSGMPGLTMEESRFDERSVDHVLKCLVTGRQVTWRSVRRRRFWLF